MTFRLKWYLIFKEYQIFLGISMTKILTIDSRDVSAEFVSGANKALALAQKHHIRAAILKARSPSCGSSQVYDGTHSHALVNGMGVTAALLSQHGVKIFDETQIDKALDFIEAFAQS